MSNPDLDNYPVVFTGEGVTRQVLSHNSDMMTVEFTFNKGGVGELHSHVHVQSTYVRSGVFDFTVDGQTMRLEPGDSIVIPSNAVHGCIAVQAGSLIDSFTPRRDDFLTTT